MPSPTSSAPSIGFSDPTLPLAVVVAATRWQEPPRMRHDVTRQLLRWFNVLFVEFLPTDNSERSQRSQLTLLEGRLASYVPERPFRVPPRMYANDPWTHWVANHLFKKRILSAVRHLTSKRSLLFNFVFDFPELVGEEAFSYKAYVCNDEFPRMQRKTRPPNRMKAWYQGNLLQHYENQVARRANRCFTPHYLLRDKLLKVNPKVDMLFHAHDFPICPIAPPRKRCGPVNVGFAGYINYRLLPQWLLSVAQTPDVSLHLIGPVQGREMESLLSQPRVNHIPPSGKAACIRSLWKWMC